ncbi:MAG: hypothetical protein WAU45_11785 [Blastocatellia bacterium]
MRPGKETSKILLLLIAIAVCALGSSKGQARANSSPPQALGADVPGAIFIQDVSQNSDNALDWADLVPDALIPGLAYGVGRFERASARHYTSRFASGTRRHPVERGPPPFPT